MTANSLVRQVPNILTTLRLLLAIPLCLLILQREYEAVLWVALVAGLSDGIDGWLARRLDAASRYGAIVDPLADKLMLSGAYPSMAAVGLLPWWLALLVIGRDIVIVLGALAYHAIYGRYNMAPSVPGKISTFLQIVFAMVLLLQQIYPVVPQGFVSALLYIVAAASIASGLNYVWVWGLKAARQA